MSCSVNCLPPPRLILLSEIFLLLLQSRDLVRLPPLRVILLERPAVPTPLAGWPLGVVLKTRCPLKFFFGVAPAELVGGGGVGRRVVLRSLRDPSLRRLICLSQGFEFCCESLYGACEGIYLLFWAVLSAFN